MVSGAPVQDAQDEIIAFLRRPDSYGLAESVVETVETHISIVFLAGECAYKLKRAVKYPYLDFSTPELRHRWKANRESWGGATMTMPGTRAI